MVCTSRQYRYTIQSRNSGFDVDAANEIWGEPFDREQDVAYAGATRPDEIREVLNLQTGEVRINRASTELDAATGYVPLPVSERQETHEPLETPARTEAQQPGVQTRGLRPQALLASWLSMPNWTASQAFFDQHTVALTDDELYGRILQMTEVDPANRPSLAAHASLITLATIGLEKVGYKTRRRIRTVAGTSSSANCCRASSIGKPISRRQWSCL
jgi:hypothetical protein